MIQVREVGPRSQAITEQEGRHRGDQRGRRLERTHREEPACADASRDDQGEEEQQDVVELQHVLRVMLAQHVGEVRRDDQQQPSPPKKREGEHARDDDGHR